MCVAVDSGAPDSSMSRMSSWGNYCVNSLVAIVCLVSGNELLAQAATLLRRVQVTEAAEGRLPLSVGCKGGGCSGTGLGGLWAGWKASSLSPYRRRRLLQDSPPPPPPASSGGSSHKGLSHGAIAGLVIAIMLTIGVVLAIVILWYYVRKRRASPPKSPLPDYVQNKASKSNSHITCLPKVGFEGFRSWMDSISAPSRTKRKGTLFEPSRFRSWVQSFSAPPKPKIYLSSACEMEFSKLQAATDNFSAANLLGEGGSARVYRAKLAGGDYGAVKMITASGRNTLAEFQAEVDLMRQVRHPNLVSLLGYCDQGERRLLVYELMPNGSLEDQLYGPKQGTGLSWHQRIKIALDSARGLEYLHERCLPSLVHRDFKPTNILLDEKLNAKISDFGLATPLEGLTQEQSLQLVGTIGYVAPEFFSSGTLTEKSDVYAFGVTLLELLTGRKPIDHSLPTEQQSLVNWATPQLTNRGKLPKLVDSHITADIQNLKHLYQVAAVAALCVQKEPSYRPLIADVVQSLIPLVPVELGGALRSDSNHKSSTSQSSRGSSQGQQEHQVLKAGGSESFSFARESGEHDLPPDISSAASSGEIHPAML